MKLSRRRSTLGPEIRNHRKLRRGSWRVATRPKYRELQLEAHKLVFRTLELIVVDLPSSMDTTLTRGLTSRKNVP